MSATFVGDVDLRGKLDENVRATIADYLRTFRGKPVEIAIKEYRATRSSQANRYYFGVVVKLLAEHCGYDADDMHECLAMKFLRIEDDPITGAPRRRRTPKTNTAEFAAYVDACIRLAAELGVVIPQPNEVAA